VQTDINVVKIFDYDFSERYTTTAASDKQFLICSQSDFKVLKFAQILASCEIFSDWLFSLVYQLSTIL